MEVVTGSNDHTIIICDRDVGGKQLANLKSSKQIQQDQPSHVWESKRCMEGGFMNTI